MPQDLPGFYFDPEKNRYFPVKGRIPGSNPNTTASHIQGSSSSKPNRTNDKRNTQRRKRIKAADLFQLRELYGKLITFSKRKSSFQHEYQNIQASQPTVWKYQSANCIADGALEQFYVDIQTPQGQKGADVLLMGCLNGSISLYEVGKFGQHFGHGVKCMPNRVWPLIAEYDGECNKAPGYIQSSTPGASILFPSSISCIKGIGKKLPDRIGDGSSLQHALVATLGSGTAGGSVYALNLSDPLDLRMIEIASLHCTIWTGDCNSNGTQAVIGTNLGAALINLESGVLSWVCRSKSDVLSQQFDQSGNFVLCGLRNGVIVAIDVRQKPNSLALSTGLPRHRIAYSSNKIREPPSGKCRSLTRQFFEVRGNLIPSSAICMSSAVCSLATLQSDDQYFLASSMDGFIDLYDRRLLQRGPLQSYEGHVNCHTRLQLGIDPSESLVMSGGEDRCVRIWDIKTGKLLCETDPLDSIVSTVCWPRTGKLQEPVEERREYVDSLYEQNHSWGAWLGSRRGLFYIHGS
ncbi:uncharacterized protein LOC143884603 isoform X1 [Tasmannia lanceolata]|uniref:uncharacterized protein LOC143884603 isoform X1 n=1 Tax=Tasmannia lanceolata TaxID=3420 RepID=UPI0040632747